MMSLRCNIDSFILESFDPFLRFLSLSLVIFDIWAFKIGKMHHFLYENTGHFILLSHKRHKIFCVYSQCRYFKSQRRISSEAAHIFMSGYLLYWQENLTCSIAVM